MKEKPDTVPMRADTIDRQELEFFATSIAALAHGEVSPQEILESVITSFDLDRQQLLADKADRLGYTTFAEFEQDLLRQIEWQLYHLESCHLTAAERTQRRLISSL